MKTVNQNNGTNNNELKGLISLNSIYIKFFSRFNWHNTTSLFTLSTGRSGTLTLIKLMDLSPDINAVHEPEPKLLDEFNNTFYGVRENPDRYRRLFKKARREIIGRARLNGKIYAEGAIMKYFAPVIAEIMPNSKFLYCYRHPGGVIRSGMRRGWYQGHIFDKYKLRPLKTDSAYDSWQNWDAFTKNCWMWAAENDFFLNFADRIGQHRILKVPFEKLIDPDTGFYQQLFHFIGVQPPEHDEICEVLQTRYNKQRTGDFPEYEDWSDGQKKTLNSMAGDLMERLGYE